MKRYTQTPKQIPVLMKKKIFFSVKNIMIVVQTIEQRTNMVKGKAPVTVLRRTTFRNGYGTKTVEIMKGKKVISKVTEPFTIPECKNVQNRKFTKGLFKIADSKTLKKMNALKRKHKKTQKHHPKRK